MTTPTPPARHHVRLATASPASDPSGLPGTMKRLAAITRRAAALHADLLVLPEAYLGGYPRGSGFGAVVGERTAEGREEFRRYFKGAVDLGDVVGEGGAGGGDRWLSRREPPFVGGGSGGGGHDGEDGFVRGDGTREELEKLSRDTSVFLVVGLIERAGGSLYCAVVYVDPNRGMIGKRRKVMPVCFPSCFSCYLLLAICSLLFVSPSFAIVLLVVPALTTPTDGLRTPHLGPGQPRDPPRRVHHHPRHPRQPRRRHLLGELHAARPPGPLRPERQPLPRPHRRRPRRLAEPDAHRRLRGPLLRRQLQHGCAQARLVRGGTCTCTCTCACSSRSRR